MLLADEVTSPLFDLKFVEGRLLCFDMAGYVENTHENVTEIMTEVEEEDAMGPIIICVDTSGSMQGAPETIAKAVTLFMASRAITQKRNCFLINFSTSIEELDLSGQMGIGKAIHFLERSFHGGTDLRPAISHAMEVMESENYRKSDLLILSDFVVSQDMSAAIQERIVAARKLENKFYSLAIGNYVLQADQRDIFDGEWIYDPQMGDIRKMEKAISDICAA